MAEVGGRAWQLWGEASRYSSRSVKAHRRLLGFSVLVAVALLLGYLWAGYRLRWPWTGLSRHVTPTEKSDQVTLWDWLTALAVPVTVSLTPLLLRHHRRLTHRHRAVLAAVLIGFAVLVAAGYLMPLRWTGFPGNRLWDWLGLLLLPVVVGSAPLWTSLESVRTPKLFAGMAVVAGFAVLVAASYLVPWTWTGFPGNTVWDWIKLLLLPVLVPTVLLPAMNALVTERLIPPEQDAGEG